MPIHRPSQNLIRLVFRFGLARLFVSCFSFDLREVNDTSKKDKIATKLSNTKYNTVVEQVSGERT